MRRSAPGALMVFLFLAFGCSQPATDIDGNTADEGVAPGSQDSDVPAFYTVRAEVVGLPAATDPEGGLIVHHEAIDELRSIDGDVWGMDAMVMEFDLAEGLSLDGISVGDKVEFTLAVEWLADVPQRITAIRELPADTELVFRAAELPGE